MPDAEMEIRHIATFESARKTLLEQRAFWVKQMETNQDAEEDLKRIDDHLKLNAELLEMAQATLTLCLGHLD